MWESQRFPSSGAISGGSARNELIGRVAFGLVNFQHHRVRCLLYAGKLRVSSHADTYEIKIGARHPEPAIAEAISLQWAETFVDRREKANLERDEDARV